MSFIIYFSIIVYGLMNDVQTEAVVVVPHDRQNTSEIKESSYALEICEFEVANHSRNYFDSRLELLKPSFMKFKLEFANVSVRYKVNKTVQARMFQPYLWFWTYKPVEGNFPYVIMNVDSGILSFDLINSQTSEVDYVLLNIKHNGASCVMDIGNITTNTKIADALQSLIVNENMKMKDDMRQPVYDKNYFCYLVENPELKRTWTYTLALYFNYPLPTINFECCHFFYKYIKERFTDPKCGIPKEKWSLLNHGSYILGLIILMYFPVLMLQWIAILAKDELVESYDYDSYVELDQCCHYVEDLDKDFVFLDGSSPLNLFDAFARNWTGLKERFPVLVSRLRRLFSLLAMPIIVYLSMYMYKDGIKEVNDIVITVHDFAERGAVFGFLGILAGNTTNMQKSFAPNLGGPVGMFTMYYSLGLLLVVLPRSLKQVVENGMPTGRSWSPLFFSVDEVLRMAMFHPHTEPGYHRAATVCKAHFIMLFTGRFWKRLLHIQMKRFRVFCNFGRCACAIALPVMLVVNMLETLLCLVYYGIPFVTFIFILTKGSVKSLIRQKTIIQRYRNSFMILRTPVTWGIVWGFILIAFSLFIYAGSLIFLESFVFVSKVTLTCLVVIVFMPSETFGYLFFVVIFVYYVFHLIGDFGSGYTELLAIGVEHSINLDMHVNHVTYQDGTLDVSNVRATNIRTLRINGTCIDIPEGSLASIRVQSDVKRKTRQRRNAHGIPRDLFEYLIKRHRPVHIQVRIVLPSKNGVLLFCLCLPLLNNILLFFLKEFGVV